MIQSIEEGKTSAHIYVDDVNCPSFCFIHEKHSLFIGGEGSNKEMDEAVAFLNDTILTHETRKSLHMMKVTYPDKKWRQKISLGIMDSQIADYDRTLFYHEMNGELTPSPNLCRRNN